MKVLKLIFFLALSINVYSQFSLTPCRVGDKWGFMLDHKFVIVFDTEKINGHVASFTGMNVKNGEQITLKMKLQSDSIVLNPEEVHIILEAEHVLEIKGSYVRVAD